MLKNFLSLNEYYETYQRAVSLSMKINLVKKIVDLETVVLKSLNSEIYSEKIIFYILNNIDKKNRFTFNRYIFILSNVEIPEKYKTKVIELYFNIINSNKENYVKTDRVIFAIKGLSKFKSENFEENIIKLEKYEMFNLYKKDFILLLGKTNSSIKSLKFLVECLKKYKDITEEICWSIGIIASFKNPCFIERKYLNDYLKKFLKLLKQEKFSNSKMFYFFLIEICMISNGLNGEILNKISEVLYIDNKKSYESKLLVKVLNNIELNSDEEKQLLNYENKFI